MIELLVATRSSGKESVVNSCGLTSGITSILKVQGTGGTWISRVTLLDAKKRERETTVMNRIFH